MSSLESLLCYQLIVLDVPQPEREYRFAASAVGAGRGVKQRLSSSGLKDWRFDLAWPRIMFAVEVEGGGWISGRHTRGPGFAEDMRKYHSALELGWCVYRCDGDLIKSGKASALIKTMVVNSAVGHQKNDR